MQAEKLKSTFWEDFKNDAEYQKLVLEDIYLSDEVVCALMGGGPVEVNYQINEDATMTKLDTVTSFKEKTERLIAIKTRMGEIRLSILQKYYTV